MFVVLNKLYQILAAKEEKKIKYLLSYFTPLKARI